MPAPAPQEPSRSDMPAATQPASVWPESTRPLSGHSTQALSHFDPAAEERQRTQQITLAAFDVCHPALALRAVVGVQAVLVLGALVTSANWAELPLRAAQASFAGMVGTLLWLVVLCAVKPLMTPRAAATRAAVVLGLGAAAACLGWWPLHLLGLGVEGSGLQETGAAALVLRALAVALVGAAMAAVLWAWLELRASIWQPAQSQARLAELQSRIRPHFLFNALNTALALVRVDPERCESVLEDLSALFRVALAETGTSVSLAEEIELAQRYLAIEQIRFGARLQVHWDIAPQVLAARVPPLMLQPLVENAVRHGLEPAVGGGLIDVKARVRRGQVVLEVVNSLPEEPAPAGNGMALANVRERLRLLHDVSGQCDVWRSGEGAGARFHARIIVPL